MSVQAFYPNAANPAPAPPENRFALPIGNTPLLDLSFLSHNPARVKLFAKAEWFNPGHSVKDRAANAIIQEALRTGEITSGRRLLDASSGNTALAYAMLGAACGVGVTLCVPENVGAPQKTLLRAFGAQVFYTSALEGSDGAILMARELAASQPELYFYADQYSNPANWQAHYRTTAPEIWRQTEGQVTHFVAGLGTSGTFTGTARRLRELKPDIRLFAVQPDSPLHGLEGMKHMATSLIPKIYDASLADENLFVATEQAQSVLRFLARKKGLLLGFSAGAALAASTQVARKIDDGVIVTVLPDNAQRYLHDRFWEEI